MRLDLIYKTSVQKYGKRPHRRLVTRLGSEWICLILTPYLIHGFLDPGESAAKRHIDRFSRFCTVSLYDQHTNAQTTL